MSWGEKGWMIVITCVLALLMILILNLLFESTSGAIIEDMEQRCQDLQGKLVFYECLNTASWFVRESDRCVNRISGYVCDLPNGSEMQFRYDAINGEVRP